jgi:hypothetical protein
MQNREGAVCPVHFYRSGCRPEKLIADNPYYVGCIDADMVTDGKEVAAMALADGCKTAVIIGGNIGDNNMDQRSDGFREAFEAGGGTILAEARCTDASECPTKPKICCPPTRMQTAYTQWSATISPARFQQ